MFLTEELYFFYIFDEKYRKILAIFKKMRNMPKCLVRSICISQYWSCLMFFIFQGIGLLEEIYPTSL